MCSLALCRRLLIVQSKYNSHLAKSDAGFSLIELLVVVVIIGALAAITAPGWIAFVNRQQVNKANDAILAALQKAQREAKKQKLSYSVSFKTDNNIQKFAIYRAKNPDGTNAVPNSSNWENLLGDLDIKPRQLLIGTNITSENNSSSTITYASNPVFSSSSKPQTITFDYMGALDLTVKTKNDGLTAVQNSKIGSKGLIVAVAVAKAGNPTQAANTKRCVIIKTLLGSLKTGKDKECE
jgi:prepilin-type N-terminal cleavage/methylation domain-containing protein